MKIKPHLALEHAPGSAEHDTTALRQTTTALRHNPRFPDATQLCQDELLFAISHNRIELGGAVAYAAIYFIAFVMFLVVCWQAIAPRAPSPIARTFVLPCCAFLALFHLGMGVVWTRRSAEHKKKRGALLEKMRSAG